MRSRAAWFLALILLSAPVRASVVTYTDHTLWQAAVSGITTINFAGLTTDGASTNYSAGGVTVSGVHFTDPTFLYVADDTYFPPAYAGCLIACLQGFPDAGGGILATLPAGVKAVGLFGFQYGTVTVSLTAKLNSGESITQNVGPQGSAFFGFTSTSDISTVNLTSAFDPQNSQITRYPTMRQFEFASTNAPEPAAAPGIGGALLVLGALLRRRRGRP